MWPKVRAFLESFTSGDIIADVGCGNGKYLGVRRDVAILASDRSIGLAEVAATRLTTPTGVSDGLAHPPQTAAVVLLRRIGFAPAAYVLAQSRAWHVLPENCSCRLLPAQA